MGIGSVQTVKGKSTIDFLIDSSLMRPRYLIRLFETARRRAVTLGKDTIDEGDYDTALQELGWQILEDFNRELVDVVPSAEELFFDIVLHGDELTLNELRQVIGKRVNDAKTAEVVIDVLIWTGCLGVKNQNNVVYISDCGFKRPFIRALLADPDRKSIVFHPVLMSIMTAPLGH
jgi:hypothetical protein